MDAREAGEEINRPGDCVQVPGKREGITPTEGFQTWLCSLGKGGGSN